VSLVGSPRRLKRRGVGAGPSFHFVARPLLRNMLHVLSLRSAPLQILLPLALLS
jgi:hypothetical protein